MSHIAGVITGLVKDVNDPDGEGRVLVEYEWMPGKHRSFWAPVASIMSGGGRGGWFMPELRDEALLAFDQCNVDHPYIIGFLWNGQDKPPSGHHRERMFRSRNGHAIRFLDSTPDKGNKGGIVIEDAQGNRIILTNGKILIKAVSALELEAQRIVLQGPGYRRVVSYNNNPI